MLHLYACAAVAEAKPAAAPAPTSADWYDVVSFQPGPEVTDASMRQKLEASGQPWKVRDRATGIELVLVMPGEFLMGSPSSELGRQADEGPQHPVQVTSPFYLGATEVTQEQWTRSLPRDHWFFPGDTKHADGSWDDLQLFLSKANADLPEGASMLRAPTETEWEYACRAGTTGPFSFDGPAQHAGLNFNDGVVKSAVVVDGQLQVEWEVPPAPECRMTTAPAGSLPPNPWGLHEMHGNLWEWTSSAYSPNGYSGGGALDNFKQAAAQGSQTLRALRGGSWYDHEHHCRSSSRDAGSASTRSNRIGFRVARSL